ncbi:MAG: BamA/TamA family outer membrane protein [Cyanobacteriota bacterium]|nr:BamA/TamA family outer membrane protein [Cyanobacteriota bacterium]
MKHKHARHSQLSLVLALGASSLSMAIASPSWGKTLPKSAESLPKPQGAIATKGETSGSASGDRVRVAQTQIEAQQSAPTDPNPEIPQVREPDEIDPRLQQLQRQGLSSRPLPIDYQPPSQPLNARDIQFSPEPIRYTQRPLEETDFFDQHIGDLTDPVRGPFRIEDPIVLTADDLAERESGFFVSLFPDSSREKQLYGVATLGAIGSGGSIFALGIEGGQRTAGLDLSYTQAAIVGENDSSIGYNISAYTARSPDDIFLAGGTPVYLPRGFQHVPWVNRIGGEVSLFVPSSENFVIIPSARYQNVQISRGAFNDEDIPRDERGNRLSFADDGTDDLLSVGLAAQYVDVSRDRLAGVIVEGTKFQVGTEQYIPIGDADVTGNRLSGGLVQYFPANLFRFADGPSVFVINLGAGTFIGDLPPYEAFSLGGASSVRGYGGGGLGTGRSFVSATLEYRFPVANFRGDTIQNLRGALFVDYGSALGSQGNVTGQPGEERDKPGSGAGFGVALGAKMELFDALLNYVWVDFALNDEGRTEFSVNVGDRF